MVSVFAIIRDAFPPEQILKKNALIMGIIAIYPTIAPIIGNFLQLLAGWRACFALLLGMGIFYLVIIGFYFQETLQEKNFQAVKIKYLFYNYKILLANKHCLGYTLTSCFFHIVYQSVELSYYFTICQFTCFLRFATLLSAQLTRSSVSTEVLSSNSN